MMGKNVRKNEADSQTPLSFLCCVCVFLVGADGVEYMRNMDMPNPRTFTAVPAPFKVGTTTVLKSKVLPLEQSVTVTTQQEDQGGADSMDTS